MKNKRSRADRLWDIEDRAWRERWNSENTPEGRRWWGEWYYRILKAAERTETQNGEGKATRDTDRG